MLRSKPGLCSRSKISPNQTNIQLPMVKWILSFPKNKWAKHLQEVGKELMAVIQLLFFQISYSSKYHKRQTHKNKWHNGSEPTASHFPVIQLMGAHMMSDWQFYPVWYSLYGMMLNREIVTKYEFKYWIIDRHTRGASKHIWNCKTFENVWKVPPPPTHTHISAPPWSFWT